MEKNIKLTVAYDGSRYHGWQRQKNGISIQELIEEKLNRMVGAPVKLIASGRTDAGVHALNQVCNFRSSTNIIPESIRKGLNSLLPDDILVKSAEYVPLEFHSRYDALGKVYEYRILNQEEPDIFHDRYQWHIRFPLDTGAMGRCLEILSGTHDFSSFRSSGSDNINPVRTIRRAQIESAPSDNAFHIVVEADGFLRHMVRNIVGTVVEVGLGRLGEEEFEEVLNARKREAAGIKAPARGLFLVQVYYPEKKQGFFYERI